ncbi:MAG: sensor histidine kinase [Anaerocolumna sp.]
MKKKNKFVRRTKTTKYRFVKNNFLLYFCTFTLPVLLLSVVLFYRIYLNSQVTAEEKLNNTINLAKELLLDLEEDVKALNLESGNLNIYLYQMLNYKKIDYTTTIALRYISSYLIAIKDSKQNIDSVYFYMPNKLDRVLTSENMITELSRMVDKEWLKEFDGMEHSGLKIVPRNMNRQVQNDWYRVCTIFQKYSYLDGGIAVNYNTERINSQMDDMLFYDKQSLLILDEEGRLLFSNSNFKGSNAVLQKMKKVNGQEKTIWLDNEEYTLISYWYEPFSIRIITCVPFSSVTSFFFTGMQTIIVLIVMTILSSIALSYYRANSDYAQMYAIIDIFDRAKRNMELPVLKDGEYNLHTQILNNIIHTFVENSYLQVQISERRYKLMATELIALQYQINPHFLFNTLQAINYEILDITHGKPTQANKMLEDLSDILRFSLESPNEKITLDKEIENCKKYIAIQQVRLNNQLLVEWRIDGQLLNAKVLRLLLQPLIENAISHGIRYKEGQSTIRINIYSYGQGIRFKVTDNGIGMSVERLKEIIYSLKINNEFSSEHIGLSNINQRLQLSYPGSVGLHILSKEMKGTVIYFDIPFILD